MKALESLRIRVYCQTCGEIFLDIEYLEYLQKHSWDPEKPDRWFVKAAIHWLETHHLIIADIPFFPTNLSQLYQQWRDGKLAEYPSEEAMIQEARRYLENCSLPI